MEILSSNIGSFPQNLKFSWVVKAIIQKKQLLCEREQDYRVIFVQKIALEHEFGLRKFGQNVI